MPQFEAAGAQVLGVSADHVATLDAFAKQNSLKQVLAYRMQATAIDYSVGERMNLYRLAGDAIMRSPILGIGLNNFSVVSNRLTGVDTVPHNLELGYLAELGVPGFLLVVEGRAGLPASGF